MLREDLLHARLVSDVRHQGIGVDIPPIPRHHQADVVQGSFRLIYQDQAIRSKRGDLAHHLATDAAGGYVDGDTLSALTAKGWNVFDTLQNNDAYHALKAVDGLIITGATGTNVNDAAVARGGGRSKNVILV